MSFLQIQTSNKINDKKSYESSINLSEKDEKNINFKGNNKKDEPVYLRNLFVKKMSKNNDHKSEINKSINLFFLKPELYFKPYPVSVGKKVDLLSLDSCGQSLSKNLNKHGYRNSQIYQNSSKIIRGSCNFSTTKNLRSFFTAKSTDTSMMSLKRKNGENRGVKKYICVSNNQLKSIFDKFRDNNSEEKKEYMRLEIAENNKIPYYVSRNLEKQNNSLENCKLMENKGKIISKYIAKKIHKNENDLLMNKIDYYRFKKSLLNDIDENKSSINKENGIFKINNSSIDNNLNKFDSINWLMSLRNSKDSIDEREGFINVKNGAQIPFYARFRSNVCASKEKIVNPNYDTKNVEEFRNIKKRKNLSKNYWSKVNSVSDLDSIKLKGENLYNIEYKREIGGIKNSLKSNNDNNKNFNLLNKNNNNNLNNSINIGVSVSNKIINRVYNIDNTITTNSLNSSVTKFNSKHAQNKSKMLYNIFEENGNLIPYKDINKIYGEKTFYKNYIGENDNKYVIDKHLIYKRLKSGRYNINNDIYKNKFIKNYSCNNSIINDSCNYNDNENIGYPYEKQIGYRKNMKKASKQNSFSYGYKNNDMYSNNKYIRGSNYNDEFSF